ncbi:MAG: hypothetical protein PHP26_06795 [Syntrophomonas sp.]|uniref:hypothetical protein n=1 Tax=Syntrophomonas wolfei TaxID=863 RepID=UPI000773E5DA|nr:hypothetical protein [Syntrophomonas wolfei]MDD2510259.1 hypothetical protein [Syntrophomonas sp.]MDD3879682.1 hypothetical protein [Syntrophomonas sp.]
MLRGLVDNAPSATIIKRLAEVAWNDIAIQDLLAAAGYLEPDNKRAPDGLSYSPQLQQWEKVIEEAVRYDIPPEAAVDLIRSLGKSMKKIKNE